MQRASRARILRSRTNKAQSGKKQKKKGKAGKVILIILLCIVVLLAAAYVYVEYFMAAPDSNGDGITNNDDLR